MSGVSGKDKSEDLQKSRQPGAFLNVWYALECSETLGLGQKLSSAITHPDRLVTFTSCSFTS